MSETTATATATTQEPVVQSTTTVDTTKPAADAKPAGDAKSTTDAKPIVDDKAKSPVSTTKPVSLIGDAGKPQPKADDKKAADASDGTKDANKEVKEGDTADKTVPEKYEIKAPEGMTLSEAKIEKFTPIAKELGLNNEGLQKLVDYQAQEIKAAAEEQVKTFEAYKESNLNATKEFYGNKLDAAIPFVAKGRDQFADAEVVELLDATGLSNHKAFVTMFEKMGRSISEHKLVDGKAATPDEKKSPGSVIYGDKKK